MFFKKILLCLILYLALAKKGYTQQHPGFSRLYKLEAEDKGMRGELIANLLYDRHSDQVYFSLASVRFDIAPVRMNMYLNKANIHGDILKQKPDTFINSSNEYTSLAKSRNEDHLFWGGGTFELIPQAVVSLVLTKTDKELNTIWSRQYACHPKITYAGIRDIEEDQHYNLVMIAQKFADQSTNFAGIPPRIYLIKADQEGNILWERSPQIGNFDNVSDLHIAKDGNYLVNGYTSNWGGLSKGYLIKTDTSGKEIWHQVYNPDHYQSLLSAIAEVDGPLESYINAGSVYHSEHSSSAYINRVDAEGNIIWEKEVSVFESGEHHFWALSVTEENEIVAAGYTYDPASRKSIGLVCKLDAAGLLLWQRTLTHSSFPDEFFYRVQVLTDGSILLAGFSGGPDPYWKQGTQDGWMVRLDKNGCLQTNDCPPVNLKELPSHKDVAIHIYPNPASEFIVIKNQEPFLADVKVNIFNISGRLIKETWISKGNNTLQVDIADFPMGQYVVKLSNNEWVTHATITILK